MSAPNQEPTPENEGHTATSFEDQGAFTPLAEDDYVKFASQTAKESFTPPQQPYHPRPFTQPEPVFYEQVSYQSVPWSPKSKLAAGLFGIFLGGFGVHNFYLGFTGKAVAQLLITILSLGILAWVSAIWGLIEGILVLSSSTGTQWDLDALGRPMRPIGQTA